MFRIFNWLKWVYQATHMGSWMPFLCLCLYTIFGAFMFRFFEQGPDMKYREDYKNRTDYALKQVISRVLEIKCMDPFTREHTRLQEGLAKEALMWFLDHLNLIDILEERTDETPWTWIGAMFYAGQLYTTIGYGVPTARTTGGRVATVFYILFGIPVFLIVLKDMGNILSRSLRKLYKRLRTSKRKIAQAAPIRRLSLPIKNAYKADGKACEQEMEIEKGLDTNGNEVVEKKKRDDFPISIAVAILILWILFSAALFCTWETQWGFFTSVYFFIVSISTVGLGDIVFSKPEMMLYNFVLILVGLALLSMCFSLIQAAIERMLDRLLDEYIEEIEKMAEEVVNDENLNEEAMPLEFKMTGNLLTLPMKRVTQDTGMFSMAKSWMAGRIANNLIASRLGTGQASDSDSEEEEKEDSCQELLPHPAQELAVDELNKSRRTSRLSKISGDSNRTARKHQHFGKYHFKPNRNLFDTIRTLEKIKPGANNDFRGMIFSKFVQSEKLNKLVIDSDQKRMETVSCQTDFEPEPPSRKMSRKFRRKQIDSMSSFSTVYTNSMLMPDDESLFSQAFCDLKFDVSDDASSPPSFHKFSSQSLFKQLEDDKLDAKIVKMGKGFDPRAVGLPPAPWKQSQPEEVRMPRPILKNDPRRFSSASNLQMLQVKLPPTPEDTTMTHVRTTCGLLPNDFDSPQTSQMESSGYDSIKK